MPKYQKSEQLPGSAADPAHSFRLQADSCRVMGSPLYATLLDRLAENISAGGVVHDLVAGWSGNPMRDAVPLRLMGAAHLLALDGRAPALAEHYPSAGGRPRGTVAAVLLRTITEHQRAMSAGLLSPPQTNEVGRAAILLGGLLEVARTVAVPIRLFEAGASAGLNLHLDRYHYELGGSTWGDPEASVRIVSDWSGDVPDLRLGLEIVERAGSDINPLEVGDEAAMLRLKSYVWADQLDRFNRISAAIDHARTKRVRIEQNDAATWIADRVRPHTGTITVICHTIVVQYLKRSSRAALTSAIGAVGDAASSEAPVAWLRFEPGPESIELRLTVWPSGIDVVLADAQAHGAWVRWRQR